MRHYSSVCIQSDYSWQRAGRKALFIYSFIHSFTLPKKSGNITSKHKWIQYHCNKLYFTHIQELNSFTDGLLHITRYLSCTLYDWKKLEQFTFRKLRDECKNTIYMIYPDFVIYQYVSTTVTFHWSAKNALLFKKWYIVNII